MNKLWTLEVPTKRQNWSHNQFDNKPLTDLKHPIIRSYTLSHKKSHRVQDKGITGRCTWHRMFSQPIPQWHYKQLHTACTSPHNLCIVTYPAADPSTHNNTKKALALEKPNLIFTKGNRGRGELEGEVGERRGRWKTKEEKKTEVVLYIHKTRHPVLIGLFVVPANKPPNTVTTIL